MDTHLTDYFKDTPLGIKSVLTASVSLAEKVNSRTDLSGQEKTKLVLSTFKDFFKGDSPELLALVESVVPELLHLVVRSARGEFKLRDVTSGFLKVPGCLKGTGCLKASTCVPCSKTQPLTTGVDVDTGVRTAVSTATASVTAVSTKDWFKGLFIRKPSA